MTRRYKASIGFILHNQVKVSIASPLNLVLPEMDAGVQARQQIASAANVMLEPFGLDQVKTDELQLRLYLYVDAPFCMGCYICGCAFSERESPVSLAGVSRKTMPVLLVTNTSYFLLNVFL